MDEWKSFDSGSSKKNRRPKKKRFGFIRSCFLLLFISMLITGGYVWSQFLNYRNFLYKNSNKTVRVETFEVKNGESFDSIAQRLIASGLIQDKKVFSYPAYKVYLRVNAIQTTGIQAGVYQIPSNYSPDQILAMLKNSGCNEIQVTLKEGLRLEEFADELEKSFNKPFATFDKNNFIKESRNFQKPQDLSLDFNVPSNIEGYLFPDTYRFCSDTNTEKVLSALLSNFNVKVINSLQPRIQQSGLSLSDVLTLASIIEREGRSPEEKAIIADILIKRLNAGIPLGVDATTQYGFGYSQTQKTWWRTGVELDNIIDLPHEYSTRTKTGLPPTPISNPGLVSINAVLNPAQTNYLYYITGKDGQMHYAQDLNGHNYNVCRYLTMTC